MKHWKTYKIVRRRPWRTGHKIDDNILLSGFGTNFILTCYISLSSQGMRSGLVCGKGEVVQESHVLRGATLVADEG
jgi:hypothetical protein